MAESHSAAGNHHFLPPQENVNQTARQFATLRDHRPQDLRIDATAAYTQMLRTQRWDRVLLSHPSRPGSSRAPGTRAAMWGSAETCVLCSSPCEDAGVPGRGWGGVTATSSSSNPRRSSLCLGSSTQMMRCQQFLSSKAGIRKAFEVFFFCRTLSPPASAGDQALLLRTPSCSSLVPPPHAGTGQLMDGNISVCSFHSTGFLPCHSKPCHVRRPRPCPDHHATVPTAAGQHWGQQPCLLPCCHCNTGDSSHSTGVAVLCAWSLESRTPGQAAFRLSCVQGHCRFPSLLPRMKAGTAFGQQRPGHKAICPQPWSLTCSKMDVFATSFSPGKAHSHPPSAENIRWRPRS